jgi:S-adenosylmethionine-diacylgycerolhomoserine-N-methlytransferase
MSAFPSDLDARIAWPAEATDRMNRMYRWQRHIYDGTRRYYLLGRDQMIANLRPAPATSILEIGCGTGRNLVHTARRYPDTRLFGVDVSTEMLTSAISAISRHGLAPRIRVAHGDATAFDPKTIFGVPAFDHVMISYSLSMIPDWDRVVEAAVNRLNPGGRLHVVDFGDLAGWPAMARSLLLKWLAMFGVTPRDDLERVLSGAAKASDGDLRFERPFRGYAQYGVLTLPLGRRVP